MAWVLFLQPKIYRLSMSFCIHRIYCLFASPVCEYRAGFCLLLCVLRLFIHFQTISEFLRQNIQIWKRNHPYLCTSVSRMDEMQAPLSRQGKAMGGLAYTPSSPNENYKNMNDIITAKEAAQLTRLKVATIHRLARSGKIPHSKPNGKNVYFLRSDIEAWMLGNAK